MKTNIYSIYYVPGSAIFVICIIIFINSFTAHSNPLERYYYNVIYR